MGKKPREKKQRKKMPPTNPTRRHALLAGLTLSLCLALAASAQFRVRPEQVVNLKLNPAQVELTNGKPASLTLLAKIMKGYHINSNKPLEEYLIPTRVELNSDLFEIKEKFPKGELKSFSFSEVKLSVYEGTLRLPLELRAKKTATKGAHTLKLTFHYQACNDRICLRPAKKEAALAVIVK